MDFAAILREEGFGVDGGKEVGGRGGVVHSFTGNLEEAEELVSYLSIYTSLGLAKLTMPTYVNGLSHWVSWTAL